MLDEYRKPEMINSVDWKSYNKEQIDKALNFIDCHFKEMVADKEAQELKSILKESGD